MGNLKIVYIGNEGRFYEKLRQEFAEITKSQHVTTIWETLNFLVDSNPQKLFWSLRERSPHIIYLDINPDNPAWFYFLKLLHRSEEFKKIPKVGLISKGLKRNVTNSLLMTGLRLLYVKDIGLFDAVYNPLNLLEKIIDIRPRFFKTTAERPTKAYQDLRISYRTKRRLGVESNTPFKDNDIIKLSNPVLFNKLIQIPFQVTKEERSLGSYYHYRYCYELKMDPEFSPMEFQEQESPIQFIKVLFIDLDGRLLNEFNKDAHKVNFVYNFQTSIKKDSFIFQRYRPQIIIISGQQDEVQDLIPIVQQHLNTNKLIKTPILLSSPDEFDEQKLKGHHNIINAGASIPFKVLNQLVQLKKSHFMKENPDFFKGKEYIKLKSIEKNHVQFERDITILSINEVELTFRSKEKIPNWTNLLIKDPFYALLLTVPKRELGFNDESVHRAVIHGVTEEQKAKIRLCINKMFIEVKESN